MLSSGLQGSLINASKIKEIQNHTIGTTFTQQIKFNGNNDTVTNSTLRIRSNGMISTEIDFSDNTFVEFNFLACVTKTYNVSATDIVVGKPAYIGINNIPQGYIPTSCNLKLSSRTSPLITLSQPIQDTVGDWFTRILNVSDVKNTITGTLTVIFSKI